MSSITKGKVDNLLTLLSIKTSNDNYIKKKIDALQLLLNNPFSINGQATVTVADDEIEQEIQQEKKQEIQRGEATIIVSDEVRYDDDGITIVKEKVTDISTDPNDKTKFIIIENPSQKVEKETKILFRK